MKPLTVAPTLLGRSSVASTHTMAGTVDDDEYVASLLKQDAQNAKKKYELVGIDAFNPKRCVESLKGASSRNCSSDQSTYCAS
jgi:hypothetical protein